jgi:hypothetical protein
MPYAIIVLHHFLFAYLLHCTMLLLAHVCPYTLDHVKAELEEPTKQAQAEDPTNLALDQGNPQCIPPIILGFSFNLYNDVMVDCALGL